MANISTIKVQNNIAAMKRKRSFFDFIHRMSNKYSYFICTFFENHKKKALLSDLGGPSMQSVHLLFYRNRSNYETRTAVMIS
jgi:hypothetical protein